ncbi:MAG TPA: right-handed parallel beta-helix repeat-containing protein [Candidatus Paceibacterota bacterium]|nr:right-handed parallel beta-helix repeat-containing protein [Candidatus Paceibacterota bacterium]
MKKIFVILFCVFVSGNLAEASTIIDTKIETDSVWDSVNRPYIIQGYIETEPGVTLTILPGTEIILEEDAMLVVNGDVQAEGEGEHITIRSESGIIEPGRLLIFGSTDSYFRSVDFMNSIDVLIFNSIVDFQNVKTEQTSLKFFENSYGKISNSQLNCELSCLNLHGASSAEVLDSDFHVIGTDPEESVIEIYDETSLNLINSEVKSNLGFSLSVFYAEANIEDSVFPGGLRDGIRIFDSKASIISSSIAHYAESGIVMYGKSNVLVQNSDIKNNTEGITRYEHNDPGTYTSKFVGNRLENNDIGLLTYGNSNSPGFVDAKNNWWGSVSGPYEASGNSSGSGDSIIFYDETVQYKPWLQTPFAEPAECCSSVIFLPGIQASRLYKKGSVFEDQLWEPNPFSSDVPDLYLNQNGASINSNIYTRDIIDSINSAGSIGSFDVYKTFAESMDQMVEDGEIKEWAPYAYDWRYDYVDIITNGTKYPNNSVNKIVPLVINMASSSKTGKVTLITHSNGGLLGKTLIEKLKSTGQEDLIDRFIAVAPPQLGTPKAIGSLLHGEEQEVPMVIDKGEIRALAENMKSAYHLLPSKKYFDIVEEPVIKFDPSIKLISNLYNTYGEEINNFDELSLFLRAASDRRVDPKINETLKTNVLSSIHLTNSINVHEGLDNWLPPTDLDYIQIAGWGLFTTKAIEYFEGGCEDEDEEDCVGFLDHRTIKTIDGDETVVAPSADSGAGKKYYLNLKDYNKDLNQNLDHGTVMENKNLQNFIKLTLNDSVSDLPNYLSLDRPSNPLSPNLKVSIHSPVSLDIYQDDNHTGLIKDLNSDTFFIEESIPNSVYEEIGEGKYIYLQDEGSEPVIRIQGLGTGTFTLRLEERTGEIIDAEYVYADIPTTANTEGELVFGENEPELQVDIEGDGDIDIELSPDEELTPVEYLELIKKTVLGLSINKNIKDKLLKRIDKLIKLLQNNQTPLVMKKIKSFNHKLKLLNKKKYNKHHHRKIPQEDVLALIAMIEELLNLLESK